MDQNRFYMTDGEVFDYFEFIPVVAALRIIRSEDAELASHELTLKDSDENEVTLFLTKDMMKQMVEYLSHEIKVLEDKNG